MKMKTKMKMKMLNQKKNWLLLVKMKVLDQVLLKKNWLKIKPAFKSDGVSSAGNSSQVSDGALGVIDETFIC